jgi:hypothetical protein
MDKQEPLAIESQHEGRRQVGEKSPLTGVESRNSWGAGTGGQEAKTTDSLDIHILGGPVVVVSANRVVGVPFDPVDAAAWVRAVIDEIAQKQTNVVRFADCFQRRPVSVDIREQQNTHNSPCPRL